MVGYPYVCDEEKWSDKRRSPASCSRHGTLSKAGEPRGFLNLRDHDCGAANGTGLVGAVGVSLEVVASARLPPVAAEIEAQPIRIALPLQASVIDRTDRAVRRVRPLLWQDLRGIVLPLDDRYQEITVLLPAR
jgi:hypothetical protein